MPLYEGMPLERDASYNEKMEITQKLPSQVDTRQTNKRKYFNRFLRVDFQLVLGVEQYCFGYEARSHFHKSNNIVCCQEYAAVL